MINIAEIKEQICDVCHKMWQLGWVAANDGNVSALLDDDTILATPTGMSKSFITPEKLGRVDRNGRVIKAATVFRVSSEIKMHLPNTEVLMLTAYAEDEMLFDAISAGAAGYVDFSGGMDTAIALRTMVVKDGVVSMQAGGGIVADSTPEGEYNESHHKMRGPLRAIELAEDLERSERLHGGQS